MCTLADRLELWRSRGITDLAEAERKTMKLKEKQYGKLCLQDLVQKTFRHGKFTESTVNGMYISLPAMAVEMRQEGFMFLRMSRKTLLRANEPEKVQLIQHIPDWTAQYFSMGRNYISCMQVTAIILNMALQSILQR